MSASAMTLANLLPEESVPEHCAHWVPSGMTLDSREVRGGDLFVAMAGARVNGAEFIDDAGAAGAIAALSDTGGRQNAELPTIQIKHLDKKLSAIAGRFYRQPSEVLDVVGITGTNGKTTCALLSAQLLHLLGRRAAVLGTLGYGLAGEPLRLTGFTTPDAIATQKILRQLVDDGADMLAMEVSSHALVQHRVRDVRITTAVLTNLSHDHLDFHGDLKSYGKAKARLLKARGLRHVILNRDDDWCKSLGKKIDERLQTLTYSLKSPKADVYCESLEFSRNGIVAEVCFGDQRAVVRSPLVGEFNASNLLAVTAVALAHGFTLQSIAQHVPSLQPAPGRMEQIRVSDRQNLQVVVDYAHTPDALLKALRALRRHTEKSLWCVFGCGGERDADKRALMGRVAEKAADHVIVTNDNPRGEDPAEIAAQIAQGMREPERCLVIADREKAIALAVQQAAAGDAVLIAGKGHEQVQVFADRQVPFSDVECARRVLGQRLDRDKRGADT